MVRMNRPMALERGRWRPRPPELMDRVERTLAWSASVEVSRTLLRNEFDILLNLVDRCGHLGEGCVDYICAEKVSELMDGALAVESNDSLEVVQAGEKLFRAVLGFCQGSGDEVITEG